MARCSASLRGRCLAGRVSRVACCAKASFSIGVGKVISGWDLGLVGQTVGSQVILVIPPDQGYGAEGYDSAGIKGTDTLVFVIDILDAA